MPRPDLLMVYVCAILIPKHMSHNFDSNPCIFILLPTRYTGTQVWFIHFGSVSHSSQIVIGCAVEDIVGIVIRRTRNY